MIQINYNWGGGISIGGSEATVSKPSEQPDYDPTAYEVGLSKGELKQLSKIVGLPAFYGTRKINGIVVYLEQRKSGTGASNTTYSGGAWQQSVALCEGEVSDIVGVWIDDIFYELTEDQSYSRTNIYDTHATWNISIKNFNGSDTQIANHNESDSLSFTYGNNNTDSPNTSWSAEHTLSGVAHVDFRYQKRSGANSSTTLPKLAFKVVGLLSGSTNPAVILKDYLTNTRYGCSVPSSEIDTLSFTTCEGICNQTNDGVKRHECNVILDSEKSLLDNIKIILSSCNGQLHFVDGKYKMHIDDIQAGSNVFDFEEKHIIGGIKIIGESKTGRANQVKAKFINPDTWKSDEVSWPSAISGEDSDNYATFLAEDNSVPLKKEFTLQSVTNWHQARFLAQQACLLSRNSLGFEFNSTAEALDLVVGDIVSVTHSTPAWTAKKFIIRSVGINNDGTVKLSGTEYQESTYTWNNATAPAVTPDTNLPDPSFIEAPVDLRWTEATYSAIASAGLRLQIQLSWQHDPSFEITSGYDFEYKKTADTDWTIGGSTTAKSGILNDFQIGFHDFRVRAKTASGAFSDWFTLYNQNILGSVLPPQNVTGFNVSNHGSSVVVSWDAPTDATDVDHIQIGVLQDGSTSWNDAIVVGKVGKGNTSIVLPALEGNYVAKFINSSGKESEAYVASGEVPSYNTQKVATFAEQQAWAGTMDGFYKTTVGSKDVLRFLGGSLFDSVTEYIDTWYTIDGLGGRTDPAVYTGVKRDLGAVLPCRISTDTIFTAEVTDGTNYIDFWGKVDLRSTWDDELRMNALNFEIRTTNDDPASGGATWSAYKPFIIIDTVTRGLQMRASFNEFDENSQLTLSELELIVEMVARQESDRAKTATSITYGTPFYTIPDLVVTPVNMATGDYMTISSETKSGFGITFYNSSGASQTRTYNYIARGV